MIAQSLKKEFTAIAVFFALLVVLSVPLSQPLQFVSADYFSWIEAAELIYWVCGVLEGFI